MKKENFISCNQDRLLHCKNIGKILEEKYIKFVRRKFYLVEHWLIAESLLKVNSFAKGFYRTICLYVFQKGVESCFNILFYYFLFNLKNYADNKS